MKEVCQSLSRAVSYRVPRPVTQLIVYSRGSAYPLCPRCHQAIEREFMCFCSSCGQRLAWKDFSLSGTFQPGIWRVGK